jgi:hypothetical protein
MLDSQLLASGRRGPMNRVLADWILPGAKRTISPRKKEEEMNNFRKFFWDATLAACSCNECGVLNLSPVNFAKEEL